MSLQDLISSAKKDKETKSQASQPSRTSGLQSLIDKSSSLSASKPEVKSPVKDMFAGQEISQGKITPKEEPMKEGFWTKALKIVLPKSVENFFGLDQTPEQKKATEEFKAKYENKFAIEDMARLEKEIDPITGKLPVKTAGEVLKETPVDQYLPFVGSISDIKDAVDIYQSAKRLEKGENTAVDDYRLAKFRAENERDSTFGAKVTGILTELPSFAIELGLTGGIYNVAKVGTEKIITKAITTTAEKTAKRKAVERILTKVAGNVAGGTVQTIPARVGEITTGAIQNMTPEYQYTQDEKGKFTAFISEKGDNPWLAIAKSFGDQWVEVVSEHSGGIFNEAISPLKNRLLKLGVFKSLNKLNPTLTSSKFMELVKSAGWDGIFAEMGEERIGELMRGLLTQVGLSEEGFKFPTKEQLAVELVSFSIPGVIIGASNKMLQDTGSGSFKEEEVPVPTEDGTVPPPPPRDVATEAEMVIGGRDILAVGQGSPDLGSDLITGLQLKLDEYHKEMEEMVLDIKDTNDSSLANIKIVQYPDGKWGSSYEINTEEKGIFSGFTSNKLSNSREEAITIAKDSMLAYAKQNTDQADFNTIVSQIERVEPTSDVGIEVRKGEREVSTEKKDHKILAINFLKSYVERGDTLKSLKEGQGGMSSTGESVSIGGYMNGKKVSTDNVIVEYKGTTKIFPLKALFDEIKSKQKESKSMQGKVKPITQKVFDTYFKKYEARYKASDKLSPMESANEHSLIIKEIMDDGYSYSDARDIALDSKYRSRETEPTQIKTKSTQKEVVKKKEQTKASGQSFDEWLKAKQPEKVTFKSAKSNKDYMGGHEAPMAEDINAPIWDLTGKYTGNKLYPDDVYGLDSGRLYSSGMDYDNEAISILKSLRDRPNARVTIYRAVPKDVKGEINAGDWVTLVREYAKDHGESNLGGEYKIIKKEVFARDIFTDANSIQEFGYDPQPTVKPENMPYDILIKRANKPNTKTGIYISKLKAEWDNIPVETKPTQKEVVKKSVEQKPKAIKQIARETGIKEPNIRRILGVGAKQGIFERVDEGVYVLSKDGEDIAYVETSNAVESLPRLADKGFKADMVFLDIPYDTPAVKGGNRGVKYELVSVADFKKILEAVKKLAKTENSPVIHMYSQAESGLVAMKKYNDVFIELGFKPVGKGQYQKTFADGSPVTSPNGKISKPEGILVFTQSGKLNKGLKDLNFTLKRPKGYQTEKPAEMLKAMIEMTTEEGDMVLDPFAGSGVTGAEAVRAGRKAYLIEKEPTVAKEITAPRVKKAVEEKKTRNVLPSTKLAPSKAVTPEEKAIEDAIALGERYSMPKTLVTKSDIKNLLANSPEFKANPVLVVDENKNLTFTGENNQFKIKAEALGLNPEKLKAGESIEVDVPALKAKGAPQQLRGYIGDQPVFMSIQGNTAEEKFITNSEASKELDQYFNDGDIKKQFLENLFMKNGEQAWAQYHRGMISFVNNPLAESPTHEALHAFLDLFIPRAMKGQYIARALAEEEMAIGEEAFDKAIQDIFDQYGGTITVAQAKSMYGEEILANDFVKKVKTGKSKSFLRQLWDKIIYFLKRLFNSKDRDRLFNDIITKKRDFVKKEYKNTEELVKYIETGKPKGSESELILQMTRPRELTSRFFSHQDIVGKEFGSYQFLTNLNKSTSIPLKSIEREIIQGVLDMPEFKGNKKINMADFKKAVIGQFLPLDIIESNTYAEYGASNLGLQFGDGASASTYIMNSPFEHGRTGHFSSDYRKNSIPKEELEIKEIPVSERNPTPKYAVIRKGVSLNEENINENVFTVAESKKSAENWIESHTNANYVNTAKEGLFGHFRSFDEGDTSHIAEIQSDSFQSFDKLPTKNNIILTKKAEIEYWKRELEKEKQSISDRSKPEYYIPAGYGSLKQLQESPMFVRGIEQIAKFERQIKQNTEELSKLAPVETTKNEKLFASYKDIWHERIIREAINIKAKEGFEKVRFPTPRTVAVIEHFQGGEEDELMPYEIINADDHENLDFGDTIDYGGEEMTVVNTDRGEIIQVAPSESVRHFDAQEAMDEDIQYRWDEVVSVFEKDLEKDFGKIETPKQAESIIDQMNIFNKQVSFNRKEEDIKNRKERENHRVTEYFNQIQPTRLTIKKYEKFIDLINKGVIAKENMTRQNMRDIDFKDKLEEKYGIEHAYWNYVLDAYPYGEYNFDPEALKKDVLENVTSILEGKKTTIEKADENIKAEHDKATEDIAKIESREAPTEVELATLAPRLKKDVKTARWEYNLDYDVEKILKEMAYEYDESKTFEVSDYEDSFKQRMAENYDADYEGMYGKDHVFFQEKGHSNQEVWVVDDNATIELFSQPTEYEQAASIEDFDIGNFSGVQFTVLNFYEKQANRYLAKYRKDNLELITDPNGYQWYETKVTPEDLEAPTAYLAKKTPVFEELRPIEMPELVRMARELTGMSPKIKAKMRGKLGYAQAGMIVLRADQFKAGKEIETAKLLAHELGHIIDWLPDKTMKRGNLLGRIFSLRKFMSSTFNKETGESVDLNEVRKKAFKEVLAEKNVRYGDYLTKQQIRIDLKEDIKNRYEELVSQTGAIKNATIKAELIKASELWTPYDKTKVPSKYIKYRESPKELYAEAISMLFVAPETLKETAPTFYTEFFEALDAKPEVKAEYFETQELLHGSTEEIYKARKEDIRKGFQKAEAIQAEFANKKKLARKAYWERLRQQLDDINYPILKKQAEAEARGVVFAPENNPKFLLQEESFIDNENFLLVEDIDRNIVKPIEEAGMIIEDIGEYLLLNRIQNDRKDIANPFGFNQKNAGQQLDHLKATVGEENFNLLKAKAQYFHDLVFKSVEEAVAVGSYNKETFETKIRPNKDTYASFQVVDYMQDYIPATIKGQIGTTKEVANPFISTILKTVALNRLNAHQRAKRGTVKLLTENFPEDIKPTKKITTDGKLSVFVPARGTGMLQLLEDGKMISYDVDPYIAETFTHNKTGDLNILVSMLDKFNNKLFKPLVTTYNLGFAVAMNPQRDFKRNYKSIPNATVFNLLSAYVKSFRSAVKYSKGELDDFTRSLVESKAINAPVNDYNFDPREDELGRILEKYGLIKKYEPVTNKTIEFIRRVMLKPVAKVLEGIRFTANTFEIVSKVAGAKVRIAGGESGKQLAYNLRNYTGTPNYKVKGLHTNTTNAIFVFSNIMKEGFKSDFRTATNPNTRSGYWWKTVKIDVLPKLFMLLASAGLLGELLKSLFDDVSEYDKTNYIIIPLGRSNGKTVYVRLPHDETGRLISATFWKMSNFIVDGGNVKDIQDIFAIGAGQLPSVTPAISIGVAWERFLTGKNPYDSFRGRYIIDDTTFQAGGGESLAKMVQWTTNNLGLTKFATYDTSKNTGVETFLQVAPFFSNILKYSNYGQQEKLNEIGQEVKQADAKQTLRDREVIAKYVTLAREDKATIFTASKYRKDLIMEGLGGHLPQNKEEALYADNLVTKFKRSLKRGLNDDPRVGAIISATSNNQKIELLKSIESDMSPEEWKTFKQGLVEDKIVTAEFLYRYKNIK